MIKISREQFERFVSEGIDAIPDKFLKKMDNVAIVVEPEPTLWQKNKMHLHQGKMLFGLYEGTPLIKRRFRYSALPDKITIFQNPIERLARDEADLKEIVKNTVWHEIAHHFGTDEERVRELEKRRFDKNRENS